MAGGGPRRPGCHAAGTPPGEMRRATSNGHSGPHGVWQRCRRREQSSLVSDAERSHDGSIRARRSSRTSDWGGVRPEHVLTNGPLPAPPPAPTSRALASFPAYLPRDEAGPTWLPRPPLTDSYRNPHAVLDSTPSSATQTPRALLYFTDYVGHSPRGTSQSGRRTRQGDRRARKPRERARRDEARGYARCGGRVADVSGGDRGR